MDPDECLKELRETAIELRDDADAMDTADYDSAVDRLVERVIALDDWLVKRGFLPKDWTYAAEATVLANPPQPPMTKRAMAHVPKGWNNYANKSFREEMDEAYKQERRDGMVRCKNCQIMLSPEPVLEAWGFCTSECEKEYGEVHG